ncbi:MAG: hypothetical protein RLZZ69_1016, partial [Cyanobacteriota bacterium]
LICPPILLGAEELRKRFFVVKASSSQLN